MLPSSPKEDGNHHSREVGLGVLPKQKRLDLLGIYKVEFLDVIVIQFLANVFGNLGSYVPISLMQLDKPSMIDTCTLDLD